MAGLQTRCPGKLMLKKHGLLDEFQQSVFKGKVRERGHRVLISEGTTSDWLM